jgi:hypothetical protein
LFQAHTNEQSYRKKYSTIIAEKKNFEKPEKNRQLFIVFGIKLCQSLEFLTFWIIPLPIIREGKKA